MVNQHVNLGLSGVVAQPMTLCSEGPGVTGSVPCVQNAVFNGLVTVNLNCVAGALVSWKAMWVF